MRGIGKTKEQVTADFSPINYLWGFITAFFASYGIARIISWTGGDSLGDALKISLLVGVCFVAAAMWVNDKFEARPAMLTLINIFYHLTGFMIAGIIISLWN